MTGIVEHFSRRAVTGWLNVAPGRGPVRVDLYVNKLRVASTYATPTPAPAKGVVRPPGARPGPGDHLPGPPGRRRNSRRQVRTFGFRVRGVWRYCSRRSRLSVRVQGQRLPIAGHGMYLQPWGRGKESPKALRELLENGHVLSQQGDIQLSKRLDTEWQHAVLSLYAKVRTVIREVHGLDAFVIYGTLLGIVRENGFIGHDVDFDAAYMSSCRDPRDAADELERIAVTLIKAGLSVEAKRTALHIQDPDEPGTKIDLFHLYCDGEGVVKFPFGVAGRTTMTEQEWSGTREIEFAGGTVAVPAAAERVVEHVYGLEWREPKPGFDWDTERTTRASEADLTQEQRTEVYWANFYAHTQYSTGSSFSEFISAFAEAPSRIIDIGCGEGRDSCAFGASGRRVLGIDQSQVGIEQARTHAANLGVSDLVAFEVAHVEDEELLRDLVTAFLRESPEPVMFYLRFFLHAITETAQASLLRTIDSVARPGDYFAAEFRTDKDEKNRKVHQKHYRRFQSAESFRNSLVGEHKFELLHEEEGTGLSPYQDEDPVLYRVVARR